MSNLDSTRVILEQFNEDQLVKDDDKALWSMLYVWYQYRNYEKQIDLDKLNLAFDYFKDSKDAMRRAEVYYLNSAIREDQKQGNSKEWNDDMYKACLAIDQSDNHLLAAQIYQRYGQKIYRASNYSESIKWDLKSYEEAQKGGDVKMECTALFNTSISYLGLEDEIAQKELGSADGMAIAEYTTFPKAFEYAFEGLELSRKYRLAEMEGKFCGNISLFYSRRFMLDSALYYARIAQRIDESEYAAGRRREPVRYLHFSDLFRKMGMADSALYYAEKDLRNPSIVTRRNAVFQMYAINKDLLLDFEQALYWLKLHDQLTDTINMLPASAQTTTSEEAINLSMAKEESDEKRHLAYWMLGIVAIAPVLILAQLIHNRNDYSRKLKQQEQEINQLLAQKAESESLAQARLRKAQKNISSELNLTENAVSNIPIHDSIVLTGSTKETLKVESRRILYLTSESNYIKVVYLGEDEKVKQKLVRQTMSNIETQLEGYSQIVRCHRAFFVGLSHIVQANSAPTGGLVLTLDIPGIKVPVSKTYISKIKSSLSEMG